MAIRRERPAPFIGKMHLNQVLIRYKDNFRRIAFEGFQAVSVLSGSYRYHQLGQNASVNQVYGVLIASAKEEFKAAYGIPGGIRLPKKKPGDRSKLFREIESGFEEYLQSIQKTTGSLKTTVFEEKIRSGYFKNRTVEEIEFDVINMLFSEDCKAQARADSIAWLQDNQYFKMIVKLLAGGYSQGVVAPNLGNLFEAIATSLMAERLESAKKEFEDFAEKQVKKTNRVRSIGQTGAAKVVPSYISRSGKLVEPKPVTGTKDAYIIVETRKGNKEFGITIKLAQDVAKVKYKSSSNEEGSPFVNAALWTNILKTYAYWINRTQVPEKQETRLFLAASLASLAVGGYSNERALVGLVSAVGGPSIRSLDNILVDIKNSNKLTMSELKINKEEDYVANKETIARVIYDEANPDANSINKTYDLIRKVNLSFNLSTYVRKK